MVRTKIKPGFHLMCFYRGWPGGVQELLRPSFPGMLRSIRKNFFHMVVYCDPAAPESIPVVRMAESFYTHRAPTKIGFVMTGREGAGGLMSKGFDYLMAKKDGNELMQKKGRRQQDSAETVHKYGSKLGDAKSLEMKNQFKDRHL